MIQRTIKFGVIGCGMMGREFASAAARWMHLLDLDYRPQIIAACNTSSPPLDWFKRNVSGLRFATNDYRELLANPEVEAVYIAVPHHLHQEIYIEAIESGKHLLGEKPFGIDQPANTAIVKTIQQHPNQLVRCASQFPFFPGAFQIIEWIRQGKFGRMIEVQAGFLHSSDLNPDKPINWKRQISTNGEYGCMGDLGLHVLHIPLRAGWHPTYVSALLSKIIDLRPDGQGNMVPCETWDNADLSCEASDGEQTFPMLLSFKRIAPGNANTWYLNVFGTSFSARFSTQNPKQLAFLPYTPGGSQEWRVVDVPYKSAYPAITGGIFEFGFSDALLQMWAAFCDELVNGRDGMQQPFYCATPEETAWSHRLFSAALQSQRHHSTEKL